jgi:hypothetical protein
LKDEAPEQYENSEGQPVAWPLADVLGIEALPRLRSGDELIGFIASAPEFAGFLLNLPKS